MNLSHQEWIACIQAGPNPGSSAVVDFCPDKPSVAQIRVLLGRNSSPIFLSAMCAQTPLVDE
jgi:hypothetical protein